ncbi:Zinc finger protein [Pleurostoma richardsiae]|uniref:Zinc finger protein n=1 Tax=Pleurostoma richardsiae TaxID=41990 RepID=A0AA38RIY5_9PEZI|nr:Zinc finger protein [Pleurostoma richardsiae]
MDSKKMFASLMEEDSPALDAGSLSCSAGPISPASTGSYSSMRRSASTSSTSSKIKAALSCVTRDTARGDCATHRFIVWAAVKRNSCPRMSASEKLECPLLRCRQRFPNHEMMLGHLAECEHLSSCEYWCYDCMRVERFDDSKCKRCLGHPSKRRKMLSRAKSFFSSLGHKSRKHPGFDFETDDPLLPPPSYDSLNLNPPQAELFSTEIVELDATQLATATTSVEPAASAGIDPQALLLPELDSTAVPTESLMPWTPYPTITEPSSVHDPGIQITLQSPSRLSGSKPSLQLNTHGLEQYRHARPVPPPAPRPPPSAPRSKNLSPSSSVRSTTSTMSNLSSVVSPISTWSSTSNAWSGICTNLTSPTTDLVSPGGFMSSNAVAEASNTYNDTCPPDLLHDMFAELPADLPPPKEVPAGLSADPMLFSFDADLSTDFSYATDIVLTEDNIQPTKHDHAHDLDDEQPIPCCSETKSIVVSAWDALQEHIVCSSVKLHDVRDNPLVDQLMSLSAKTIATTGLRVLRSVLNGQTPTSPIDTLCFTHLVYSLSLVVYEDDAPSHFSKLFSQCLSYTFQFAPPDRHLYHTAVMTIWQPDNYTEAQSGAGVLGGEAGSLQRSSSNKGKQRATDGNVCDSDSKDALLSTAIHFLDELEASAVLSESSSSLEVLSSELWTKHTQDLSSETPPNNPFTIAVSFALNLLTQHFFKFDQLGSHLAGVQRRVNGGSVRSVRRLELEVLQAGKISIPAATFFNAFVPQVRGLCNQLYEQHSGGASRRNDYYSLGIALIESIITELDADPLDLEAIIAEDEALDDLLKSLTDPTADCPAQNRPVLTVTPEGPPSDTTGSDGQDLVPPGRLPADSAVTNGGSSPLPSTSQPSEQADQKATESHACCEICGYRPKGDPQWFRGSMAKHKKLQHSAEPPKIFKCPFPGCTSQYKNRPDNLRQHQIEKGHFVEGEEGATRRPSKRKKMS